MNNSATIAQMKDLAYLAASAAQASLQAVAGAGKGNPSPAAQNAARMASKAASIWEGTLKTAEQAKDDAVRTKNALDVAAKLAVRGSKAYATSINRVQVPPPIFTLR